MDELAAWLLLPLVLAGVWLGVGLLVERLARAELNELVIPVGFAASLLLLSVPYALGATGSAVATVVAALVALAGFGVGRRRVRSALPSTPLVLAVLAAYLLYIAPVALTGSATFTGYTFFGDNSVHFSLVDHVRERGTHMSDLPFSSYGEVVRVNLGNGYPLGPHFQLASLTDVLGADVAWLYQSYLASVIALGVLPGARLLRSLELGRWTAAAGGFAAAAAYLPYAYGLQGGAKELAMIVLVLLGATFAAELASGAKPLRPAMLFGISAAAAFTVYSAGGLPWFLVMGAAALAVAVVRSRERLRTLAVAGGALAVVFAVGAAASLGSAIDFFGPAQNVLAGETEVTEGNLGDAGLPLWESFGIWLAGDFRFGPDQPAVTYALIALAAVLALAGAVHALRARALGLLLAAGSCVLVWVVLPAGIYIEAKLLVIMSPMLLLLAFAGAALLARGSGRPAAGLAVGALLALAVLVSDGMAYRDAHVAPKDRLDELRRLGERFAGQGPALFLEFEEYGKHLLRDSQVIATFDGYALLAAHLPSGQSAYSTWTDLDALGFPDVRDFELVVQRRNPVASRPPASFRRAFLGNHYEVWRQSGAIEVLERLPLGTENDPTAPIDCAAVRELAARDERASLAVAERPQPIRLAAAEMERPPDWPLRETGAVSGIGAGELRGTVAASPGRYRVWVRGTFGRGVNVLVDGRLLGRAEDLQTPEQMALVAEAELEGDSHEVVLVRGGPGVAPGNGRNEDYESVFLEPVAEHRLREVSLERAGSLCGRRADWVELVGG